MKSGIQRVVRNVINSLPEAASGIDVVPVVFKKAELLAVERLETSGFENFVVSLRAKIIGFRNLYWSSHDRIQARSGFHGAQLLSSLLYWVACFFSLSFVLPLSLIDSRLSRFWGAGRASPLAVRDDDVLVLLDSSWHSDLFTAVEQLKARGVTIVSVVYDLIPLTHPELCDEHLVRVFNRWLYWIAETADGFIAISETIKKQLAEYVSAGEQRARERRPWFSSFYLGADLDECAAVGTVRPVLNQVYEARDTVYLTVSTIEPRKNHAYQLDAFERYWTAGGDASLCIVGRVGWKSQALMARIESHPEFKRRLFVFSDLSDDELEYCYLNSKALIFSSIVEGFGLPLVEASQKGLPVICSEIPIFREIGGEHFSYFDLASPAALTAILFRGDAGHHGDVPCLSWPESTKALLRCVEAELLSTRQS